MVAKYVGGYERWSKHGQGTYTYADGDKYVGEFKDDIAWTRDVLTYADGDQVRGKT